MLSPFFKNQVGVDTPLHLERFPPAQVNRSLQAWDATDEYLLSYLDENQLLNGCKNILIFNDTFGALACNLTGHKVCTVSDSYLSQQGTHHNLALNSLEDADIQFLDSLSALPEHVDIILFRIPKSNALLAEQLSKISAHYSDEVKFIAGARAKDIHTSTLNVFEKLLGNTKTSLAVKKSRLVFSELTEQKAFQQSDHIREWTLSHESLAAEKFTVSNHAGVFSRESLDIGARVLMSDLPNIKGGATVVDLGCGNGVIGLSLLAKLHAEQHSANIIFKDESFMAVASAEQNIKQNLPDALGSCEFSVDDCLTEQESNSVDIVVCNPPFHQQHATTDHIAWQMFNDAKRVLRKGGELRIVGNRQLAYHVKLKRVFGNCKLIASDKKFVVLSSIKK